MVRKALHLNFKYVKRPRSLLKQPPFRYSITKKKSTSEDDSTSCASYQESSNKKRPQVPQEAMRITIDSDVPESHNNDDDLLQDENDHSDDDDDDSIIPPYPLHLEPDVTQQQQHIQQASSTSDILSAALLNQSDFHVGITVDREQRLVVPNCIPANIVLLPPVADYVGDFNAQEGSQSSTTSSEEESKSSFLQDRLEHAETLIRTYRDTIRSNEHLIDYLHLTIAKTQEEALNVMSRYRDMEKALEEMLLQDEKEEEITNMLIPEPKVFLKMAMATSLLLYFFGVTTEYPLIATVIVFLLEGFMQALFV